MVFVKERHKACGEGLLELTETIPDLAVCEGFADLVQVDLWTVYQDDVRVFFVVVLFLFFLILRHRKYVVLQRHGLSKLDLSVDERVLDLLEIVLNVGHDLL